MKKILLLPTLIFAFFSGIKATAMDANTKEILKTAAFDSYEEDNFDPEDTHCLYGADADLIMLSMTLPLKNLCIIR